MTPREQTALQDRVASWGMRSHIAREWDGLDTETRIAVWIAATVALVVVMGLCWLF
jgi:hypothetical protein